MVGCAKSGRQITALTIAAQRDPLAMLDEGDVGPKGTIMHALTAYGMLAPGEPLPDVIGSFLAANDLKAE